MLRTVIFFATIAWFCSNASAGQPLDSHIGHSFQLTHGSQGTGNYKGKRDRHEKAGPQNEKKKKSSNWLPLRK